MINSLKARGLNQTLDFDLTFHEDINIITGKNGSGKTSVLKLLWYAISGNLERIIQEITFDSFEVVTDKVRVAMGTDLTTKQPIRTLTYQIGDTNPAKMSWPLTRQARSEGLNEASRQIARASGASIFFPTFRRIEGGFSISSGLREEGARGQMGSEYAQVLGYLNMGSGSLQQAMNDLSERVSVGAHRLVASTSTDDIDRLLTSQYAHVSERNNHLHMDLSKFILERVGGGSRNGAGANAAEPLTTEETLEEIQQRVRNVTQQSDALLRPFTVLSKLVSQIFEYKGITVRRAVTLGDAREAIMSDVLSSGEKQMLSFLCYNAFANDTCLFIDEPEISLHVDWQRVLFPILLQQSTGNQFIVATHSPFIYSKYADKELVLSRQTVVIKMPTPRMSEMEIIEYLKRTSLPTLLVEGEDDALIYRWLENQIGIFAGSILICSGRDVLVSIYRQRARFPHSKIAWLADQDMWLFTSPPAELAGIILTTGYSIENDLYAGSEIESLLEPAERSQHSVSLQLVCRWFAFEVLENQAGRDGHVKHHINRVIDFAAMDLDPVFCAGRGFSEPDTAFAGGILANYKLHLRGKTLLQALVHYLSDSRRNPKYSYASNLELCLKLYPANPHIGRIVTEARAQLA